MLWSRNRSWSRPFGWNRSRSCSRSCTVETAPAPPVVKLVKLVIYRFCYVHSDMECIVQSTYCTVKVYAVYFTFHILYSTSICSVFYSPHTVKYTSILHAVYFTAHIRVLYNVHTIFYCMRCILKLTYCTLYTDYAVYFTAHILYNISGALYSARTVQYMRCNLQPTYWTVQCTCSVQYMWCALQPTYCTVNAVYFFSLSYYAVSRRVKPVVYFGFGQVSFFVYCININLLFLQ